MGRLTFFLFLLNISALKSEASMCYQSFNPLSSRLYLEHSAPTKGNLTYVLIHGLGDQSSKWGPLSSHLVNEGFGVLKVDLHGHGKTLKRFLDREGYPPSRIDYRDQVKDLKKILMDPRFERIHLVGHSYGGGIALALSAEPELTSKIVQVSLLAPYVQRLDRYMVNRSLPPAMLAWKNLYQAFIPTDITDFYLDFTSVPFMKSSFRKYFETLGEKSDLPLEHRVDAAVATTVGIRGLDMLTAPLTIPKNIPFQLYIGNQDRLVPSDMLIQFYEKMRNRGYKINYTVINGSHFFPYEQTELMFDKLAAD